MVIQRIPISKDFLLIEFKKISSYLEGEVNIYFIGGCALSLLGIKSATYDADIIIETPTEMNRFAIACEKAGYSSKYKMSSEHKFLYPGKVFDNPHTRLHIDVFNKVVVGKLRLTNSMKQRASKFADLEKLHMYTCSREDIFLFKSLASIARSRDLEDLELLYIFGLDWKLIQQELTYQSSNFEPTLSIYFIQMMDNFQENKEITIPKGYLSPISEMAKTAELEQFVKEFIREGKEDEVILKDLGEVYSKEEILSKIKKIRQKLNE